MLLREDFLVTLFESLWYRRANLRSTFPTCNNNQNDGGGSTWIVYFERIADCWSWQMSKNYLQCKRECPGSTEHFRTLWCEMWNRVLLLLNFGKMWINNKLLLFLVWNGIIAILDLARIGHWTWVRLKNLMHSWTWESIGKLKAVGCMGFWNRNECMMG